MCKKTHPNDEVRISHSKVVLRERLTQPGVASMTGKVGPAAAVAAPILVPLIVLSLVSCVGAYVGKGAHRLYDGPPLPLPSVAIVEAAGGTPLILRTIDGKPGPNKQIRTKKPMYSSGWNWSFQIELLPGEHALVFDFEESIDQRTSRVDYTSLQSHAVTFLAEPGKLYRVISTRDGLMWRVQVIEVGAIPDNYQRPRYEPAHAR